MKVLSVIHFPEFGGPHNQMLRLSEPLAKRGVLYAAVLPEGAGAERLRDGGVPVEIMNLGRVRAVRNLLVQFRTAARFPRDVWALLRLFNRERPDVVQLSGLMNPHAAIAARLLDIPVMWQLLDTRPPPPVRRLMMYPIRLLSDSMMSVGDSVARAHPGSDKIGSRMTIFYPPVDTLKFQPRQVGHGSLREELHIPFDAPLVGVVGNINPQKGHEHFIDAAFLVRKVVPKVRFAIAGHIYPNHQQYYDGLLQLARSHGLVPGEDIYFLGSRRDVPEIMASLDVFALASVPNSEGTPTVILEAMASGVPVVATDVGAVREVVEDNFTGMVVPPMDPLKMASAIITLIGDNHKRESFGSAARSRIEREFTLERCVDAHIEAFENAKATSRRRQRHKR